MESAQNRLRAALGLFLFVLSCFAGSAFAFPVPEKLTYDLTWSGIKAGTAVQEAVREKNGVRIISTARSADYISRFFPVDDRNESFLSLQGDKPGPPLHFVMRISEGKTKRHREIRFEPEKRSALWIDHLGKEKETVPLPGVAYDTLSCLYYVRSQKLEPGKSVFVDILDNLKLWNTEVKVLRREKLKTPLGEFSTLVLKPIMKSEGIFNRKGEMLIWVTDDPRHVPLKMQSKVKIGSITATLVSGLAK